MNRSQMLAELRDVISDLSVAGSWSDTRLLGYLSEGQDKFCEDTGYFGDITNYSLTLATGTAMYAIPPRAIQVMDIWDGTKRLGKVLSDRVVAQDTELFALGSTATGRPSHWQTDQTTGFIKLTPTPTLAENGVILTLHVWRHSRYDLAGDGATAGVPAEPEIPSRFHRACIEWAAYKAFMHHDVEAQDPVKAGDHLQAYRVYVSDGKNALRRIQNMETRVGSDPAYRT